MKVLMVTMALGIGGAETHIVELSKALASRGVEVAVASAGGVYEAELAKHGILSFRLPLDKKDPLSLIRARCGLAKLIRREGFDIVHAHARIPAFVCGSLQKKLGFRFVTTDHGVFRLDPVLKRLSNWGEYTFAVSEDIRSYLLENYALNPDHIALTVNGIDTVRFSPEADDGGLREKLGIKDRAMVLHVSRLEKESSVCAEALTEAAALCNGRVVVVLVGDGSWAPTLREHAASVNERLGYPAVLLAGARTNVEEYLAACDIFVGPSRAAMEAMACGKPTIISGSEGHGGIFGEELCEAAVKSNFCFRGGVLPTPELLAKDILTLLDCNAMERAALGFLGREFICRHYSVERMTETHLAVYRRLISVRTGGAPDVVICGYYGYGNSGDDALLAAIVEGLRRHDPAISICVMSSHPKKTRAYYMTDAVGRFRVWAVAKKLKESKLLLFGGGNLLQDKTSTRSLLYYVHMLRLAHRCGTGIMVYANGIGPVTNPRNIKRIKEGLALAGSISLRERYSFDFVKKLCPCRNMRLTFDPAIMTVPAGRALFAGDYFVTAPKKISPEAEEKLVRLMEYVKSVSGAQPLVVSMYDAEDLEFCRRIAARTGAVMVHPQGASEFVMLFAHARIVLSSRLHGLIYATSAACPMMSFSDDVKLESYLDYLGFGRDSGTPCAAGPQMEEGELYEMAGRILARKQEICRTLAAGIPMWRTLAEYEISEIMRALHGEKDREEKETGKRK